MAQLDPSAPDPSGYLPGCRWRRCLEGGVIFFLTILFVRVMAVEPFGVPTGSMAPTLIGNHRSCPCPRCGFAIAVGEPHLDNGLASEPSEAAAEVDCPNCGYGDISLRGQSMVVGDRLLVDKNVFMLRAPRRWEVAVFRCPCDDSKPYVKRVVGLPGEHIQVHQGDIYANGQLQRKSLDQARALALPVYDQRFVPQPNGWRDRWLQDHVQPWGVEDQAALPVASAQRLRQRVRAQLQGSDLIVDATALPSTYRAWVLYRHRSLDRQAEEVIRDAFCYNASTNQSVALNAVHDFLVECELEVQAGVGWLVCQLTDGSDRVQVELPVGWADRPGRLVAGGCVSPSTGRVSLQAGQRYRLLFAFVDRRVAVGLDGVEICPAIDLPALPARAEVSRPLRLGVQGGLHVRMHGLRLLRDLHYLAVGRHGVKGAYPLGPNDYFVLGDNSANSEDSRWWPMPGVPRANFLGKPFLLHQPSRLSAWTFLGWPLQTRVIDWGRVRWLR